MRSNRLIVILWLFSSWWLSWPAAAHLRPRAVLQPRAASSHLLTPILSAVKTSSPDDPVAPAATVEAGPVGPQPRPWDGASRVTVLVMGLDYRDWEEGEGAARTDTMILFTIDPLSKTAGMLNIPRDLWVNIPGFGYERINTAYRQGVVYNYPGGGPGLAIDTVEQFIGVPIHFYAQIDFYAFEQFINELDGIQVDVPYEIRVDPLGPGNTVTLEPGVQVMDGPIALAYARARYTEGGDFDRGMRQQQVIMAMRSRILKVDRLPMLVAERRKCTKTWPTASIPIWISTRPSSWPGWPSKSRSRISSGG
jgi:polyisoprenyl-teichoic acid--peptidoglycan teichoic acid transferase